MSTIPQADFIRGYRLFSDKERATMKARRIALFLRFVDAVRYEEGWVKVLGIAFELNLNPRTARRYAQDLTAAGYARIKIDKDNSNAMLIRSTK